VKPPPLGGCASVSASWETDFAESVSQSINIQASVAESSTTRSAGIALFNTNLRLCGGWLLTREVGVEVKGSHHQSGICVQQHLGLPGHTGAHAYRQHAVSSKRAGSARVQRHPIEAHIHVNAGEIHFHLLGVDTLGPHQKLQSFHGGDVARPDLEGNPTAVGKYGIAGPLAKLAATDRGGNCDRFWIQHRSDLDPSDNGHCQEQQCDQGP